MTMLIIEAVPLWSASIFMCYCPPREVPFPARTADSMKNIGKSSGSISEIGYSSTLGSKKIPGKLFGS